MLLTDASYIELPAGSAFARVGDALAASYFPDSGLLSVISEMATGHHIAITAVGAEGMIGFGSVFGVQHYSHSPITLVPSNGHLVRTERVLEAFNSSETIRRVLLAYIGGRLADLAIAVACNRVHSHRQRLARWLLVATDRANQRSLAVTHDVLAQMVGGPRHAVTAALKQLRAKGAISPRRGRVEISRRAVLVDEACECYAAGTGLY
jgi:CRP-like cAMP-binding protein